MQKKKIADLTNYSVLTVESSEDVAIIPTSDAHLKNGKFILKHEDWIANKICRSLHVCISYQSTEVASPSWPFRTIGSFSG